MLGVVFDESFGQVIACGAGGTSAELLGDVAVRITPLSDPDAAEMLHSLRIFPLLSYRGQPACDVEAVRDTLQRLSALVETHPEIAELDLNPLLARPSGAAIVDARIRLQQAPVRRPPRRCAEAMRTTHGRVGAFPQTLALFSRMATRPRVNTVVLMRVDLRLMTAPVAAVDDTDSEHVRLVLADDHESVRRSLRLLLSGEPDVEVVAEAGDLQTAVRQLNGSSPNVLVLDLHMRGAPGIETIRRLRLQAPETEIVVVTMEPSPVFAQQMIEAGAIGFVLKDRADVELPAAVRHAAKGEEYISPQVAARLQLLRRAVGGDGLSPREVEVLRLIALGHTSAEIAEMLHLSRRTVETHRARIQRKLGVTTRAELVAYALQRRLICD